MFEHFKFYRELQIASFDEPIHKCGLENKRLQVGGQKKVNKKKTWSMPLNFLYETHATHFWLIRLTSSSHVGFGLPTNNILNPHSFCIHNSNTVRHALESHVNCP